MWFLISTRLRRWLLVALVLPLVGRVLERIGMRVGASRPRAGRALVSTGSTLRRGRRGRRFG